MGSNIGRHDIWWSRAETEKGGIVVSQFTCFYVDFYRLQNIAIAIMHPAKYSSRAPPGKKNFHCVVQGCESSSKKNIDLSFHAFPKIGERSVYVKNHFDTVETIDRFKAWTKALKIKTVTGQMRVCALHFTKEDYLLPGK